MLYSEHTRNTFQTRSLISCFIFTLRRPTTNRTVDGQAWTLERVDFLTSHAASQSVSTLEKRTNPIQRTANVQWDMMHDDWVVFKRYDDTAGYIQRPPKSHGTYWHEAKRSQAPHCSIRELFIFKFGSAHYFYVNISEEALAGFTHHWKIVCRTFLRNVSDRKKMSWREI